MKPLDRRLSRTYLLLASCAAYAASLASPCYYTHAYYYSGVPTAEPILGVEALLFGWVEVLTEGATAWLANPLWLAALALILAALVAAGLGLAVSLSFQLDGQVLVNEAGHRSDVVRYGVGYWLWVLSFAFLCAASLAPGRDGSGERSDIPDVPTEREAG